MSKVILPNLKSLHMFENKKILITGGTGSLGIALTTKLLKTNVDTIRIFSRDELKQSQMESHFHDERLRFLIGDVRDKERLEKAVEGVDIVVHTAALKQVPVIEYDKKNVGAIYLSKQDEIGISINNDYEYDQIVKPALKLLMKLNQRKRYLANTSPKDVRSQEFLLKNGFTSLEYVYEMKK